MPTPTATPNRRNDRPRGYPDPVPSRTADDETIDYWEEVALARLRLGQLALVVALAASVLIALILG